MLDKKDIKEIFLRFTQQRPIPTIELDYCNPYTLLVAVILSAQATDVSVNKVTARLFEVADNPEKMLSLGEVNLSTLIKSIGLYNTKSKNIIATSELLVNNFQGIVPDNMKDLQTLPGVGRKSANVILNTIFKQPTIAVDTHVFRLGNRIGFCSAKNPLETEIALQKKIPTQFKLYAHHWLVLHGRYICKARKPLCTQCVISDLCEYNKGKLSNIT